MPTTALAFAMQILESLPTIINMTEDAVKYVSNSVTALKLMQLEGRDPTDAEWDALNKTIQDLRAARPDVS